LNNLQTDNAPSISVVIPPFIFGSLSFLALSVLIILADTDLLGPYFNGRILAVTHLAVLGWATMIVFGALYQLVPVVFGTALYSEKIAKITTWLFAISVVLMVYSFWVDAFSTLLIYASSLMFFSLLLFIINISLSKKKGNESIQSRFISVSVYWLLLTALLGLLISINFKWPFLPQVHLEYLKIHAHLGLIGWFTLLIIGASSTLIPMFLVSHKLNEKKLYAAFFLINTGLALLTLDWLFLSGTLMVYLYWVIISSGLLFYLAYVFESYKKRLRRELDIGMKYSVIAIALILIPVLISIIILMDLDFEYAFLLRVTTLYGFSIIFGLITSLILGQTYKTLPFIIWLYKYKQYVGKFKIPMPKDLYSEKLGQVQIYAYFTAVSALTLALLSNLPVFLIVGSYALLLTALLYNLNVFKVILHKTKKESL